ncbi:MAG: hypothetical protein PHX87_02345 [Candidatus Peribacteraceae bacterium]|nr:hypothetical protein [Candidatus Peribacteraceae bacterium]MDD5742247.1 hypothetical protein [Candidatus Peribacteraceae bacterium]
MEKPTDQQRVFIAGRVPGAIAVLPAQAIEDPTLEGYVRETCEQVLTVVEVEFAQEGKLPEAVFVLVRDLRVAYIRAVDGRQEDASLIARFCRVLGETLPETEPVDSSVVDTSSQEPDLDSLSSDELATLCAEKLSKAEFILKQGGDLTPFQINRLYRLRDAYNEALDREAEDEDDENDGDMALYTRFKVVLGEVPKNEQKGRPFPRSDRVKSAETSRGGSTFIARKR